MDSKRSPLVDVMFEEVTRHESARSVVLQTTLEGLVEFAQCVTGSVEDRDVVPCVAWLLSQYRITIETPRGVRIELVMPEA